MTLNTATAVSPANLANAPANYPYGGIYHDAPNAQKVGGPEVRLDEMGVPFIVAPHAVAPLASVPLSEFKDNSPYGGANHDGLTIARTAFTVMPASPDHVVIDFGGSQYSVPRSAVEQTTDLQR